MEIEEMGRKKGAKLRDITAQLLETDSYLVSRILSESDKNAAETLLGRHYKYVYKNIYMQVHEEELAKDLTQETFIAVLRALGQFDDSKAAFKTWIAKIAQNKVIDYLRSRQNAQRSVTVHLEESGYYYASDNVEETAMNRYEKSEIENRLEKYDADSRKIFELKTKDEMTFTEISAATGFSVSGVKRKYYGVVKNLRKEMQDYD